MLLLFTEGILCCFRLLLFTEEKNYEESVRLMRRLLTVSPDHLGGTVQLATSLMELGESSSEAKSLFLSVLSRDPGNLQALRHLGRLSCSHIATTLLCSGGFIHIGRARVLGECRQP